MKKVYLHMGFHKTGTTSFQETCRINRGRLIKFGYDYPAFHCDERPKYSPIRNHSIPIFSAFTQHPQRYHINIRWKIKDCKHLNTEYLNQLNDSLNSPYDIILSGEDISVLKASELIRLKVLIEKADRQIFPLAVIRSPYEFCCSAYQQQIKSGKFFKFDDFISQIGKIEKLMQVFGEDMQFLAMREICQHNLGPVGFLLETMGINPHKLKIMSTNEGVSNKAIRIQNILNKVEPVFLYKKKLNPKHLHYRKSLRKFQSLKEDSKFYLTEDEYLTGIKQACDEENDYFKRHLGPQFCDQKIKFSKPLNYNDLIDFS